MGYMLHPKGTSFRARFFLIALLLDFEQVGESQRDSEMTHS